MVFTIKRCSCEVKQTQRKGENRQGRTGEVDGIHKAVRTCGDGSRGESLAR